MLCLSRGIWACLEAKLLFFRLTAVYPFYFRFLLTPPTHTQTLSSRSTPVACPSPSTPTFRLSYKSPHTLFVPLLKQIPHHRPVYSCSFPHPTIWVIPMPLSTCLHCEWIYTEYWPVGIICDVAKVKFSNLFGSYCYHKIIDNYFIINFPSLE